MSDLISKGRHVARPTSIQFGFAGQDDKPQAVIGFQIVGEQDPFNGWSISAFCFLHEASWERSIESLRNMGWTGDDLQELPALCEAGQLGDVEIVIDHEEYQGAVSAKVKWINKVGGGAVKLKKPMEGDALKRFSAQMRSKVRTVPSTGPARPANASNGTAPQPAAATGTDDIPF